MIRVEAQLADEYAAHKAPLDQVHRVEMVVVLRGPLDEIQRFVDLHRDVWRVGPATGGVARGTIEL